MVTLPLVGIQLFVRQIFVGFSYEAQMQMPVDLTCLGIPIKFDSSSKIQLDSRLARVCKYF
jgi:hypothetical protein